MRKFCAVTVRSVADDDCREGNQDPGFAEVDTAAADARQDMTEDLTGVGGMFSDNAPHIDPVLKIA